MPRNPQWANWPFDYGWLWWPSGAEGKPGHVRIGHLDTDRWWELPIRTWDAVAQKHMSDRTIKPGQPVGMGGNVVLEIPYAALDDEADALVRRQMRPNMDRSNVIVRARDGTFINKNQGVPRDWWENLAAQHVQRRKQEPPVTLNMGGVTLAISYECFDAMVKDFVKNMRDRFISAGMWPELLIHEGIHDPSKPGPLPVQGRANAFGQGTTVVRPGQPAPPGQPGQGQPGGQVGHPAIENQELV